MLKYAFITIKSIQTQLYYIIVYSYTSKLWIRNNPMRHILLDWKWFYLFLCDLLYKIPIKIEISNASSTISLPVCVYMKPPVETFDWHQIKFTGRQYHSSTDYLLLVPTRTLYSAWIDTRLTRKVGASDIQSARAPAQGIDPGDSHQYVCCEFKSSSCWFSLHGLPAICRWLRVSHEICPISFRHNASRRPKSEI